MDPILAKIRMTVDYLFGRRVSSALPKYGLHVEFSKRTGRIRSIFTGNQLFAAVRPDGSLAVTIHGAKILSKSKSFSKNCVTISGDAVPHVSKGKSVFAKHVIKCGSAIRPRMDVAVLSPSGNVVAVGKAVLSAKMMKRFKVGVAVKVRRGIEQL